ncbi:hypothetical protein [uncultured Desulfosarcina sp.]|uniref:hypothetical protein n=1 Tax=uncultured Desulfosarcina sp. TaxID=218289 RepID=UPI0029C80F07|nr:hypothetical protein [uncultured Desulfosarcina sp.]
MPFEKILRDRIVSLINEGEHLRVGDEFGDAKSIEHIQKCSGYVAAANHAVQLAIPDPKNAYRKRAESIESSSEGFSIARNVGELRFLLHQLLGDIDAGLLVSFADRIRAETFDDFLDHAKKYLSDGRKNEAGVISGVVFEDSFRRICRKYNIEEKNQKLDKLISVMATNNIISQTKAKRARVAADVRTKATHAQWDEFDKDDVKVTIDFVEELIMSHFDS